MNSNLQKINNFINNNPELENLSDWEIAEKLNEPDDNFLVRENTEVSEARGLLLASGSWAKIVIASENTNSDLDLRMACITVRDTLSAPTVTIRTKDPEILNIIQQCLESLKAANIISEAVVNSLLALSLKPKSWAETNLGGPVTARDIVLAKVGE